MFPALRLRQVPLASIGCLAVFLALVVGMAVLLHGWRRAAAEMRAQATTTAIRLVEEEAPDNPSLQSCRVFSVDSSSFNVILTCANHRRVRATFSFVGPDRAVPSGIDVDDPAIGWRQIKSFNSKR